MARRLEFIMESRSDGKKIKDFLRHEVGISHRMLCILKREPEGITVNGVHARAIDILHTGDSLVLTMPDDQATSVSTPTKMPLDIVYEDADIFVLNKPAGLAMHETHNHQGDALSNAVAYYWETRGEAAVFRAVGRLDKGTSGLVVCAKNKYAAYRLAGHIEKTYYAVACGVFTGSGTIDAPIFRPDPNKTLRAVGAGGEHAVTHWEALKTDGKCTLLRIHLETGRTHQIRVHFKHLGAPLVGDDMYESPDLRLNHQALHCGECVLLHPVTGEKMVFSAPLPEDMAALLTEMD
ncbi:MAG: RluA family pseudouridine synthase [Candidatus Fimenecus sp.]